MTVAQVALFGADDEPVKKTRGTRIICPVCGHPDAKKYDYDQGGRGKRQRANVYMGYCTKCRATNGSSGNMRICWDGDRWVALWTAPRTTKRYMQCIWCDAYLVLHNKTGYCKACRPKCQPARVAFAQCAHPDCGRWFAYRPSGLRRGEEGERAFCTQECNRQENRRLSRQRQAAGGKPKRRTPKRSTRIAIAYRYGYKCAECRKLLNLNAAITATNAMQIDHIIELAAGGTDDEANLRPLCVPCHRSRRMGDLVQLPIA